MPRFNRVLIVSGSKKEQKKKVSVNTEFWYQKTFDLFFSLTQWFFSNHSTCTPGFLRAKWGMRKTTRCPCSEDDCGRVGDAQTADKPWDLGGQSVQVRGRDTRVVSDSPSALPGRSRKGSEVRSASCLPDYISSWSFKEWTATKCLQRKHQLLGRLLWWPCGGKFGDSGLEIRSHGKRIH